MKFLHLTGTNIKSGDAYAKRLDSHHEAVFFFLSLILWIFVFSLSSLPRIELLIIVGKMIDAFALVKIKCVCVCVYIYIYRHT